MPTASRHSFIQAPGTSTAFSTAGAPADLSSLGTVCSVSLASQGHTLSGRKGSCSGTVGWSGMAEEGACLTSLAAAAAATAATAACSLRRWVMRPRPPLCPVLGGGGPSPSAGLRLHSRARDSLLKLGSLTLPARDRATWHPSEHGKVSADWWECPCQRQAQPPCTVCFLTEDTPSRAWLAGSSERGRSDCTLLMLVCTSIWLGWEAPGGSLL